MRRRRFVALGAGAVVAAACRSQGSRTKAATDGGQLVVSEPATVDSSPNAVAPDPAVPSEDARVNTDANAVLHGFTADIAPPSADEYIERQARVRAALPSTGARALVVEPGPNMIYLAGVQWSRSERPFLAVLTAEGELSWVCPAFEERRAREQLGAGADVRTYHEHEDPFAIAAERTGRGNAFTSGGRRRAPVAVDPDARAFIYQGVAGHVLARIDGRAVLGARMRKTPAELARLRRVNEATKAALALVAGRLRVGLRQSELAANVIAAQHAAGLRDVWVLALFGPAAAFPHGTDEDRALAEGDLVLVDTGGALHGYRSDVSRTWAFGHVGDEERRAWDTVVRAQAAALERIRAGVACSEPDAAARKIVAEAGFGRGYERFTHRLGHGIGLQVHEDPYLRPGNALVLQPGMTMSNEPGIYVADRYGVRIEDIVVVTDGDAEILGAGVGTWDDPFAGHHAGAPG